MSPEISMKKDILPNTETLYSQLLERPTFAWEGKQLTISQKIDSLAKDTAAKEITRLYQKPIASEDVIEKLRAKAETWQAGPLLEHIKL